MSRALAPVILSFTLFMLSTTAQLGAQPSPDTQTTIVPVAGAPIVLTTCRLSKGTTYVGEWKGNIVIGNRTHHMLAGARLQLVAYDAENTKMDERVNDVTLAEPLASAETIAMPLGVQFRLNGWQALLTRISCRVQAAVFSANARWTYGQPWNERLVPLAKEPGAAETPGSEEKRTSPGSRTASLPSSDVPSASRPQLTVSNAWNDTLNGITYIHTAVVLRGGETSTTVRPTDVQLSMALANGARKTYTALAIGAPTYQKLNPLGSTTTTAYEVSPTEDFGRLGILTIPAHGDVHITATFAVPDVLGSPNDNRAVNLR